MGIFSMNQPSTSWGEPASSGSSEPARPAVSVIMPVFNQESWIGAAIDSVLDQDLPDWELIIVDDASTDASVSIAQSYAARDPARIRLLRHPHSARLGAAASRNAAISEARGRYIAFLDADDLFCTGKLGEEVRLLDSMPEVAMLYGPAVWRWQDGRRKDLIDTIAIAADRVHVPPSLAWRILLDRIGNVPCTCAVLIRTDVARALGGFEESFRLYEDQTLWAKIFLRYPVYVASVVRSIYRQHETSTSSVAALRGEYHVLRPHSAQPRFLDWMEQEATRAGVADARCRRALWRARLPYRWPIAGRALARFRRHKRRLRILFGAGQP
jgi:GT2 family glycosyltransferase